MTTTELAPKRNRAPVLDVLHASTEPLTVTEIAEAAGCATITVRRHLDKLLADGKAINIGVRPRTTSQGRPRAGRGEFLYIA